MDSAWVFLPIGYALSVAIETPVLLAGLSREHSRGRKLLAGLWLTACTYPVVILVFPEIADPAAQRGTYLLLAESFAPLAECLLFAAVFAWRLRDCAAIAAANLLSFAAGEALCRLGAFG